MIHNFKATPLRGTFVYKLKRSGYRNVIISKHLKLYIARRKTIKVLSGSDRENQRSLVLQNVINVPGCLEIHETNAINQLAGTTEQDIIYSGFVTGSTSRTFVLF